MPSAEARAAMTANARYVTRAPKGIFFYKSHEEMIQDRERWTVDAVVASHQMDAALLSRALSEIRNSKK